MRLEAIERQKRLEGALAFEEGARDVEQERSQVVERGVRIAREVREQRLELVVGGPGLGRGVGHRRHLRLEERRLRRVTEETSDEIDVERARDGLREEQRIGAGAGRAGDGLRGQVVPCDVGHDVGRNVGVDEDVASGIAAPEGQVEAESPIPPSRLRGREEAEAVAIAEEHLLEICVQPDVPERRFVLDGKLVERGRLVTGTDSHRATVPPAVEGMGTFQSLLPSWRRMRSLLTLSGTQIASLIRRRDVSSRAAVDAHIAQIEDVNPALNAVVRRRFGEARGEADAADRRLAEGADLPPFHGVPCTIKECFALTGMPQSAGLVANRAHIAEHDAVTVARLRAAGAIPLGVTNVSELCMWMESNNNVYGRTNNPYDLSRTVGGSSGGEGAIIGAGASPFGLGSDIGGSIRMPAFFNGIFGHKPSGGLVDNGGQVPPSPPGVQTYLTTGPLARRAEDLAPLLTVLAGSEKRALRVDPATVDLSRLRVVTVEDDGRHPVDASLRESQARAAALLAKHGARVEKARVPGFRDALDIWSSMLDAANGPSFSSLLGRGTPIHAGRELARWARGKSPHTFPAIGLAIFEKLPALMPERGRTFVDRGHALRREVTELIGPDGVMLYPPYPRTAPRHGQPILTLFHWVYTAIFNVLELPVTAVPLGLDASGLPLGVQVAGIHGNDHLTIAVALALERELGGWVPPKMARL